MAHVAVIGRLSLRQRNGQRNVQLAGVWSKASAADRLLRTVQRRFVQSSVPTSLENYPIIKTSAQSGVKLAVSEPSTFYLKRAEFPGVYGGWLKNKLVVSVNLFQLGQRASDMVFIMESFSSRRPNNTVEACLQPAGAKFHCGVPLLSKFQTAITFCI